jgi:FHS family L-fucose permease-like MFS transporter
MEPSKHAAPPQAPDTAGGAWIVGLVTSLFFFWGLATVLVDTLIPKLKALFALSYAEVMLTQFCFFLAYFVVSLPAGWLLARIGYLRGVVLGLAVMALGCCLFAPAAQFGVYWGFLAALFTMAAGITLLQVAANPLMAGLGAPERSHSRLTLAQAFNSLGTTVGPLLGAALILAAGVATPDPRTVSAQALARYRQATAAALQAPFLIIAAGLAAAAVVFWLARRARAVPAVAASVGARGMPGLLRRPRIALGALAIFIYVGAEVSIGSLLVNFLMQKHTLGAAAKSAGQMVSLYWGGAMIGRFLGAYLLRHLEAASVLLGCAVTATALASIGAFASGSVAAFAVIAVGLANSIMFPTIFTLAIDGLAPEETPRASGLICMAIVGGAVVPMITGFLADQIGLSHALLCPATCYACIAAFALMALRRPPRRSETGRHAADHRPRFAGVEL